MPRKRREWVPYAYHHIYSRGNNRQNIFKDQEDMEEVFRLLSMIHLKYPISISAYAVMTNHYHFLLKSEQVTISTIMSMFNRRYTDYFNRKYNHIGHLYQHRFGSSPVLYPLDLLKVSKYIHRNPISTNPPIVKYMENYPYSSFQYYKKRIQPPYPFINLTDLPASFNLQLNQTYEQYCKYVEQ
jgi:putative transposase